MWKEKDGWVFGAVFAYDCGQEQGIPMEVKPIV